VGEPIADAWLERIVPHKAAPATFVPFSSTLSNPIDGCGYHLPNPLSATAPLSGTLAVFINSPPRRFGGMLTGAIISILLFFTGHSAAVTNFAVACFGGASLGRPENRPVKPRLNMSVVMVVVAIL
jgi:hypothetical protein